MGNPDAMGSMMEDPNMANMLSGLGRGRGRGGQ